MSSEVEDPAPFWVEINESDIEVLRQEGALFFEIPCDVIAREPTFAIYYEGGVKNERRA